VCKSERSEGNMICYFSFSYFWLCTIANTSSISSNGSRYVK